jgi:hypothetical protein
MLESSLIRHCISILPPIPPAATWVCRSAKPPPIAGGNVCCSACPHTRALELMQQLPAGQGTHSST